MTDNTARSRILARVRRASNERPAAEIDAELQTIDTGPPPTPLAIDAATGFLARVLRNGGTIACARDRSGAVQAVSRYLLEHYRSQRVVVANDARLGAMPWREAGVLPRFGAAGDGDPAALSYARLGVAETGAVVTYTGRANPGSHNLLAEDHIVLLDLEDLYPTLEGAWERIGQDQRAHGRPRGINFIAGPSSTADVEARLVKGAHGPRRWHVILLGKLPDQAPEDARRAAEPGVHRGV